MYPFYKPEKTIEHSIVEGTSGFDIHYQIADGESNLAADLREATVNFIKTFDNVYITANKQFEIPVGPWAKPMWEIQISTVPDLQDLNATSANKLTYLDTVMHKVAAFLKKELQTRMMQGSLLIHANVWPDNSNQSLEYELHFNKAWVVYGKNTPLKDIWNGEYGLISMEQFVKTQLQAGTNKTELLELFLEKFSTNPLFSKNSIERLATSILDAQSLTMGTFKQKSTIK
jgi:hypothetical protein